MGDVRGDTCDWTVERRGWWRRPAGVIEYKSPTVAGRPDWRAVAASYKRRQHQRDDRQVTGRNGCLDEPQVSPVGLSPLSVLWSETGW